MPKITPMAMPQTTSLDMLRQFVTVNLNKIGIALAQTDNRTQPMSMGGYRLTNVPDPSNATDAVNLRTLKKYLQGIGNKHQQKQAPEVAKEYFTVVWANSGTVATGTNIVPPYIFNPNRLGSPGLFKVYAVGTGSTNSGFNFLYLPGGNGTGTQMLSSDLILGGGATGPVSANNFSISPSFSPNDVVYPIVTTAGGCSVFSLEMLVTP
jgi:hypothetical protein